MFRRRFFAVPFHFTFDHIVKRESAKPHKHPTAVETAAAVAAAEAVRPDTAQKPYLKILEQEINEGIRELQRPTWGLLISGLSAGLDVSFSVLVMAVILTTTHGAPGLLNGVFLAGAYAVGYIFVVMGTVGAFYGAHHAFGVPSAPWRGIHRVASAVVGFDLRLESGGLRVICETDCHYRSKDSV